MKKSLIIFSSTVLLMACNTNQNFQLTAQIQGVDPSTVVYLEKIDPLTNQAIKIDSTSIDLNNKAIFSGHQNNIDFGYVAVKYRVHKAPVILEAGKILLQYDLNSSKNPVASGTPSNDQYQDYKDRVALLQNQINQFTLNTQEQYSQAIAEKDTQKLADLKTVLVDLQDQLSQFIANYPKENPTSIVNLINIQKIYKNPKITKSKLLEHWALVSDPLKQTPLGKVIQKHLDSLPDSAVAIGNKAPDFQAPTPDGTMFSLQQGLDKITIIDFWAAWCAPCRMQNPILVELYKKYHSKGLQIIGVSLDKDKDKWLQAIEQDNLSWPQVSNLLYFKDPIANTYEIKSIPATFIVDQKGVIIAKDLTPAQLTAKLAELLD
ncbi:redoxin domain-containing protein [Myroides sp. LJL110]